MPRGPSEECRPGSLLRDLLVWPFLLQVLLVLARPSAALATQPRPWRSEIDMRRRLAHPLTIRRSFDILLALKGQDSYGAGFWSGLFGAFLPQPPHFSGGQRRVFTFGLPAHRSFLGTSRSMTKAKKKQKESLISQALNAEALRLRAVIGDSG
jgi:hypothetical protein